MTHQTNAPRLSELMDARRRELGLRWKDVATAADISEETVRTVRNGGRRALVRTTRTEARIERALRWEKGSIQAVRDGGQPKLLPGNTITTDSNNDAYPSFVGDDPGYQAIWDIPQELLPAEHRKFAVLQIEFLRSLDRAAGGPV